MKKNIKEMPLINFKGITGKFVSLEVITNNCYPYTQYELTIITEDGYEIKIKPIKEEDVDRIITCLKCSRGKKVNCWRSSHKEDDK